MNQRLCSEGGESLAKLGAFSTDIRIEHSPGGGRYLQGSPRLNLHLVKCKGNSRAEQLWEGTAFGHCVRGVPKASKQGEV